MYFSPDRSFLNRRSSLSSRDYRRGRERYDRRDRSPERDGSRDRYRDRSRERFRDRRDRVRDHREPERNRDRSPDRYRRHRDSPDYERVRDRSSDRSDRSREVSPQNERGKRTPERKERVERSIDSRDDSRKSPGAVDEVQTEERENLSEKEEIVTRSPVDDVKPDVSPQKAEDFETEGKDEYEEPKSPADLQVYLVNFTLQATYCFQLSIYKYDFSDIISIRARFEKTTLLETAKTF